MLFSDMLVIPAAMGMEVIMPGGVGMQILNPVQTPTDLEQQPLMRKHENYSMIN